MSKGERIPADAIPACLAIRSRFIAWDFSRSREAADERSGSLPLFVDFEEVMGVGSVACSQCRARRALRQQDWPWMRRLFSKTRKLAICHDFRGFYLTCGGASIYWGTKPK